MAKQRNVNYLIFTEPSIFSVQVPADFLLSFWINSFKKWTIEAIRE